MAYGGSKTGDWEWAVKADYWKDIPDFDYHPPSLAAELRHHIPEMAALLFWLLAPILVIHFITNRLNVL